MNDIHQFEYDAFISYSSKDIVKVEIMHHFLQSYPGPNSKKLKVYLDKTDLATKGLWAELNQAIKSSKKLLLVISEFSSSNLNVIKEVNLFEELHADGEVIIVLISGQPSLIPSKFTNHKYADLRKSLRFSIVTPKIREELLRVLAAVGDFELRDIIPWDRKRRITQYITFGVFLSIISVLVVILFLQERNKRESVYSNSLYSEAHRRAFQNNQIPISLAYLHASNLLISKSDNFRIANALAGYFEYASTDEEIFNEKLISPLLLEVDREIRLYKPNFKDFKKLPLNESSIPNEDSYSNAKWNLRLNLMTIAHSNGNVSAFKINPIELLRTIEVYDNSSSVNLDYMGLEGLTVMCINSIEHVEIQYYEREGSSAGMVTPITAFLNFKTGLIKRIDDGLKKNSKDNCSGQDLNLIDLSITYPKIPFEITNIQKPINVDEFTYWENYWDNYQSDLDEQVGKKWSKFIGSLGLPEETDDGFDLSQNKESLHRFHELQTSCDDAKYVNLSQFNGKSSLEHLIRFRKNNKEFIFDKIYTDESVIGARNGFLALGACKVLLYPRMTLLDLKTLNTSKQFNEVGFIKDIDVNGDVVWLVTESNNVYELNLESQYASEVNLKPKLMWKIQVGDTIDSNDESRSLFVIDEKLILFANIENKISLYDIKGKKIWVSLPNENFNSLVSAVKRTEDSIVLASPNAWMEIDLKTGFPLSGWQKPINTESDNKITKVSNFEKDGFMITYKNGESDVFKPTKQLKVENFKTKISLLPIYVIDGEIKRGWH